MKHRLIGGAFGLGPGSGERICSDDRVNALTNWINAVDPSPASDILTLAEVNDELTVYLIEVEDHDELAGWRTRNTRSSSNGS
jgi:hypothetical protein